MPHLRYRISREDTTLIEVKNLVKRYGTNTALKGISFKVERGHIYGFLGPNGAGKSTTMNIITGCLAATEGEVIINGHDIFEESVEAKRSIGYLPEQPPVYPDMTPAEYLTFVAEAKGIEQKDVYEKVNEVMEMTGLVPMQKRLIKNLSKGYRQRVGIAQAILGDPEVIILDEPTVGLDPKQIIEIRQLITSLGQKHTVILSSHILSEISAVCDYIIIISRGRVVASDTLANIRAKLSEDKKLELLVRGDENKIRMTLNEIEGIESYETALDEAENAVRVILQCVKHADIREALFFAFSEMHYPVLSMTDVSATLEDVFLNLTEEASTAEEEEEEAPAPVYKLPEEEREEDEVEERTEDDASEDVSDDDDDDYTPMFGGKE
ncbi:MAG: ATP-binding cassette domain-containing protein [Clostridia bacterium]|nr:ATP-binding cassette domain-containing protein [Clostridia bacterium]